jgi:alkylated DNA repair dioxygenase AlkB
MAPEPLLPPTGATALGRITLKPHLQSLDWNTFVHDDDTQSYSFHLSQAKSPWTSQAQLDGWFQALHPSNTSSSTTSSTTSSMLSEKTNNNNAWTEASYRGETLLRQTAWVVFDEGCKCEYGYADTWQPISTCPKLRRVLQEITNAVLPAATATRTTTATTTTTVVNCCNLNYYPQGGGVGFHADDEFLFDGLVQPTAILSLSLCGPSGGSRKFQIQPKAGRLEDELYTIQKNDDKNATGGAGGAGSAIIQSVLLEHGDLMTMEGMFQKYYFHSVWPGDSKDHVDHPLAQGGRINLTWRTIVKHLDGSDEECRGKTCPLHRTTVRQHTNKK